MKTLEERIGYHFRSRELLEHALRHSSYLNEHALPKGDCNERLEFLGDAILEMTVSEYLYHHYPDKMEGEMSKNRAALVCEHALAESASEIGLGDELLLGHGMEMAGGRKSESLTSDAFEALIAAIFLDGGLEEARKLINAHVLNHVDEKLISSDAKTTLQEILQSKNTSVRYEVIEVSGPEHDRSFTAAAFIGEKQAAVGTGHNKKQAEQAAAYEVIRQIRDNVLCI